MKRFLALFLILFPFSLHAGDGGKVIDDCWKKGGSHVESVDCEYKLMQAMRQKMEQAYEAAKSEGAKMDEEIKGSAAAIVEQSVIDSQKAFENYMEKECERKASYYGTGTFAADAHIGCAIDLMTRRTEELSPRVEKPTQ